MHTRSLPAKAGNDGYAGTLEPSKKRIPTLIQITDIEKKYLSLYEAKITIRQFELWLYENEELITRQKNRELYENLIQINFNTVEAKAEISKSLEIDYDSLFRYKIQLEILNCINAKSLEIKDVKYQALFDLNYLSFSFSIENVNFLMHNPFDYRKFTNLNDVNKEIKFRECFKNEKLFLATIIEGIGTKNIRIWSPKLTEQMDRMTKKKYIETRDDELKIIIGKTYTFIKTNYLNEKMKEAWL